MTELKKAISTTKQEEDKEVLKRTLGAMRNRRKADEEKARREEVEKKHRRRERELVEQGKQPFFLKRGDVRERVLTEKFEGMKGKEITKTLERRARKKAQRERRQMPNLRRNGDGQ
jgi:ribosomal RNA-processing protein 36